MKIFISEHTDLRVQGLAEAIEHHNDQTFFWKRGNVPVFDLMETEKPDIVFYHDDDASDNALPLAQKEYPDTKFVFMQFFPSLYHHSPDLVISMNSSISPPESISLDYLANSVSMQGGEEKKKYASDVLVLTDNIDPANNFIMLILRGLSHKFNTKIFGHKQLPIPNYLGRINYDEYKHALSSARILVSFDEGRAADALMNSCYPLVFKNSANREDPHHFNSFQDLSLKCASFLEGPSFAPPKPKEEDCYVHVAKNILTKLGS